MGILCKLHAPLLSGHNSHVHERVVLYTLLTVHFLIVIFVDVYIYQFIWLCILYIVHLHTCTSVNLHCSYTCVNDQCDSPFLCDNTVFVVPWLRFLLVGLGFCLLCFSEYISVSWSGKSSLWASVCLDRWTVFGPSQTYLAWFQTRGHRLLILAVPSSRATALWWFPWLSRKREKSSVVIIQIYLFTNDFLSPCQIEKFVYPLTK